MPGYLALRDHGGDAADVVKHELRGRRIFQQRPMAVGVLQHVPGHGGEQGALAVAGAAGDQDNAVIRFESPADGVLDPQIGQGRRLGGQGPRRDRTAVVAAAENSRGIDPEAHPGAPVRPDFVRDVEVATAFQPGLAVGPVEPVNRLLDLRLRQATRRDLAHAAVDLDEHRRVGLQPDVRCAFPVGPDHQLIEAAGREHWRLGRPQSAIELSDLLLWDSGADLVHGVSLIGPAASAGA